MALVITFYYSLSQTKPCPETFVSFYDFAEGLIESRETLERWSDPELDEAKQAKQRKKTPPDRTLFGPGAMKGARNNANVEYLNCAVLDIDKKPMDTLPKLIEKLEGLEYCLYTTFGHGTDGLLSVRVVIPLSTPVVAGDWEDLWEGLYIKFDGWLDRATQDAARQYFLPTNPPEPEWDPLDIYEPGEPIDVQELFRLGAGSPKQRKPINPARGEQAAKEQSHALQAIEMADLKDLANRIRRSKSSVKRLETARILDKIIAGAVYANDGEMDISLWNVCKEIGNAFPSAMFDDKAIRQLFLKSVSATLDAVKRGQDLESDLAKIYDKITRAQENTKAELSAAQQVKDRDHAARCRNGWKWVGERRETTYTEDEIEEFNTSREISKETASKQWIIRVDEVYYLFINGTYISVNKYSLIDLARDVLAPAKSAGVVLTRPSQQGEIELSEAELMRKYGTVAKGKVYELGLLASYFDNDRQEMHHAVAIQRAIEPEYSPDVDRWLQALADDKYPLLKKYLAAFVNLKQPLPLIYLHDGPQSGKSVFVDGMSRMFRTTGPTDAENFFEGFQEDFKECPVVLADEKTPKQLNDSDMLKVIVQKTTWRINEKFKTPTRMVGAGRFFYVANHKDMIKLRKSCTAADIEALMDRVLYIQPREDCADVFASCGGSFGPGAFQSRVVSGDELAKHVHWLAMTATEQDKLDMAGNWRSLADSADFLQRKLVTSGPIERVLAWAVKLLRSKQAGVTLRPIFENEVMWATVECVKSSWAAVMGDKEDVLLEQDIGAALMVISRKSTKLVNQEIYYEVATNMLTTWSEETKFWSPEGIVDTLANGGVRKLRIVKDPQAYQE